MRPSVEQVCEALMSSIPTLVHVRQGLATLPAALRSGLNMGDTGNVVLVARAAGKRDGNLREAFCPPDPTVKPVARATRKPSFPVGGPQARAHSRQLKSGIVLTCLRFPLRWFPRSSLGTPAPGAMNCPQRPRPPRHFPADRILNQVPDKSSPPKSIRNSDGKVKAE